MLPKDLIGALKASLEQQAQFEDKPLSIQVQYDEKLAKATITHFIEGKWISFEVWARPLGETEPLGIG